MICYKDKTFCPFWRDCAEYIQGGCHRAMTPGVVRDAKYHGLPMSQFTKKPSCFEEIK